MFRPSFERGSILKKDMLEALRDYPYKVVDLMYSNYGDGIIFGFEISSVEENEIVISPGIIKIDGNVYLSTENMYVEQKNETQYVYVELSRTDNSDGEDFTIVLRQSDIEKENGIELFRYTKNAKLFKFKNIHEVINLPMNRINVNNQKQSINGGYSIAHHCLILYAREILDSANADAKDIAFAYQCLNGINDIKVIEQYFGNISNNDDVVKKMREKIARLNKSEKIVLEEPVKKERPKQMIVS